MKAFFGALLCLVFGTSQAYALKGGPPYPAGTNVVGTYAGVLVPRFNPTDPLSSNSLGLFSLSIPGSGLGTGNFVMFARGGVFRGTIQALGDPSAGTIKGILDASLGTLNQTTFTDIFGFTFTTSSNTITARAQGTVTAKVAATRTGLGTASTLLTGTAKLFVTETASSSSTPTPTASASASPTATPAGGGTGGILAAFTLDVNGFKQSNSAVQATTVPGTGGSGQ